MKKDNIYTVYMYIQRPFNYLFVLHSPVRSIFLKLFYPITCIVILTSWYYYLNDGFVSPVKSALYEDDLLEEKRIPMITRNCKKMTAAITPTMT